jgi:hypothetical protein
MHKELDTFLVPIVGIIGTVASNFDTYIGRATAIVSLGFVCIKFAREIRKENNKVKKTNE